MGARGRALHIIQGGVVHRDQAGAGAAFDGQVAQGHAPFHRQRAHGLAGIFDDIAGAAGGADLGDHRQGDVLGGDAFGQLAVHGDAHVLGLLGAQGLGRQHMLDFGGADAEGQRAERAMGGGVAVAADDGGAGQGPALFRPDDVHDALADIVHGEIFDAEIAGVLLQGLDLRAAFRIGDALVAVLGGHIVVGHRQGQFRAAHLAARQCAGLQRPGGW